MRYAMDVVDRTRRQRGVRFCRVTSSPTGFGRSPLHRASATDRCTRSTTSPTIPVPSPPASIWRLGTTSIRRVPDVYIVLGQYAPRQCVGLSPGDTVRTGAVIGRVGNSMDRAPASPHASHAQPERDWWHADLPMHFGGRFLVRNQMLRKSSLNIRPSRKVRAIQVSSMRTRRQDLAFALRSFSSGLRPLRPPSSLIALGIAANTIVFSIANELLIKRLARWRSGAAHRNPAGAPNCLALRPSGLSRSDGPGF